jgi:hypothetical protein
MHQLERGKKRARMTRSSSIQTQPRQRYAGTTGIWYQYHVQVGRRVCALVEKAFAKINAEEDAAKTP